MWRSFGDRYDLSKHDDTKYKRKIRTTTLATILLFVTVLASNVMFSFGMDWPEIYRINVWISIASAILMAIFMLIKYLVNNKEIDMSLPMYTGLLLLLSILYSNL